MMNRIAYHLVLLLTILAMAGTVAASDPVRLPDLGGTSTRVLPAEQERTFARDFRRYLRANNMLIEDPMVLDYIEDMGFRLVAESSRRDGEFHFFVIREPSLNAFASLAGVIGIHAGLILAAREESEVAGVVAHEIAHITQDHIARGVENQRQTSIPAMLATLGLALAAGAAGAGGEASQAILMSGMGLAQQFQINHTRQAEAEADRIAVPLMARAGYDPMGMVTFFEQLSVRGRAMGEGPPEYLRTHPLTVNRIAEARNRADRVQVRNQRDDDRFAFVQARLRVLISSFPDQTVEFFRIRLENAEDAAPHLRYGLALSLIKARRLDAAAGHIEQLRADHPDRQLFKLLEADLLLARGAQSEAIERLETLYHRFPGNRLITTQLAETLMHERSPERSERAATLLRQHLRSHPDDLQMTQLYARAADAAGDSVRAAEAQADSYYMRGGIDQAIEQLEAVIERDDLNYYQRARISARLAELRGERIRLGRS